MRKIFILLVLLSLPTLTFAVTKAATPSATPKTSVQTKIDDLKERLATKVAELRKTSPRAIFGTVSQVSVSSLTVDTNQKAYKIDLTDDIKVAQLLKGKRTALSTDSIDKEDTVTIFGNYDETLDIIQAKNIFIEASTLPRRIQGMITAIDKKNNAFTVKSVSSTEYIVDVESTTKNNAWAGADGIIKSGFSKLETGMFATVVGIEDAKNADHFTAQRILTVKIPDPNATPTPTFEATPTATLKPSPTKKPTPTTKPKATPKVTTTP